VVGACGVPGGGSSGGQGHGSSIAVAAAMATAATVLLYPGLDAAVAATGSLNQT